MPLPAGKLPWPHKFSLSQHGPHHNVRLACSELTTVRINSLPTPSLWKLHEARVMLSPLCRPTPTTRYTRNQCVDWIHVLTFSWLWLECKFLTSGSLICKKKIDNKEVWGTHTHTHTFQISFLLPVESEYIEFTWHWQWKDTKMFQFWNKTLSLKLCPFDKSTPREKNGNKSILKRKVFSYLWNEHTTVWTQCVSLHIYFSVTTQGITDLIIVWEINRSPA